MKLAIGAVVGVAAALQAAGASAHPRFMASSPARGAVVAAPEVITLSFSEAVRPEGSTFQLSDAAARPVRLGPVSKGGADSTLVIPVVRPLAPGAYILKWRVASAGHAAVPGLLRFQVKR